MASLVQRIKSFLNSPQGRQVVDRGRRELAKPGNQEKLRRLISRAKGSGRPR
ncbi:hypothetical protein O7627_15280 [Solwaraspora sp. WMMD1047]|uniref:hypothetical protein n=1 Tax=Solwaraspora sp. WMMD1047 TaxID=3016102 RepID=UPI0024171A54|nr:hypothetical protein [Solwaraspora sp. WMMD1047]MDG4830655.1 hypothetical protein [Solwaraspora sp. WMMD1047]